MRNYLLIFIIMIFALQSCNNDNTGKLENEIKLLEDSLKRLNELLTNNNVTTIDTAYNRIKIDSNTNTKEIPFKDFAEDFIEAIKSSKEEFLTMSENTIVVFSEFHPSFNKSENINENYIWVKDYVNGNKKIQIGKNTITFIDKPYERTMMRLFFKTVENKWKYFKMEMEAD